MRNNKSHKEFTDYNGVKMSFIASVNLAKHTWDMAPSDAFDWYISLCDKRKRYQTIETAETYREALEDDFINWVNKNAHKDTTTKRQNTPEVEAAIVFLAEKGYTVTKKRF